MAYLRVIFPHLFPFFFRDVPILAALGFDSAEDQATYILGVLQMGCSVTIVAVCQLISVRYSYLTFPDHKCSCN